MSYWNRTEEILAARGGRGPPCTYCGEAMYPIDDHGRFSCSCDDYRAMEQRRYGRVIPQVTEDVPDEVKKEIPPINRLNLPPTAEEKEKLEGILKDQRELLFKTQKQFKKSK